MRKFRRSQQQPRRSTRRDYTEPRILSQVRILDQMEEATGPGSLTKF
ncbi:hypothetical protein I553_1045 [Mycobacterium xenopi 4042]|uniref:Uncharacterized protein n=1 Tax=Mycobacterium xenopi 4042 TaxID=1299334 RepID=X7ZBU9_MYCXE|nr:hypothetical protein I553_1045 [Mycobacterium xenopi 4042]